MKCMVQRFLSRASEIVQVLNGAMKESESILYKDYKAFMGFVQDLKSLGVYTNADTPHDAQMAVAFGAEGIGPLPNRTHVLWW